MTQFWIYPVIQAVSLFNTVRLKIYSKNDSRKYINRTNPNLEFNVCGHCHALLLSPYDMCTVSRSLSINWPTPAQGDRLMWCIHVLLWPSWVGLCLMCEHAGCSVRINHQLMPSTRAYMWPSSMGRSLPPTSAYPFPTCRRPRSVGTSYTPKVHIRLSVSYV